MGTNYYWYERPACPTCGRRDEPLHVGKSSAGWVFALRIYPELGIHDLDDWRERWRRPGSELRDEYDRPADAELLEGAITQRTWHTGWLMSSERGEVRLDAPGGARTYDLVDREFC